MSSDDPSIPRDDRHHPASVSIHTAPAVWSEERNVIPLEERQRCTRRKHKREVRGLLREDIRSDGDTWKRQCTFGHPIPQQLPQEHDVETIPSHQIHTPIWLPRSDQPHQGDLWFRLRSQPHSGCRASAMARFLGFISPCSGKGLPLAFALGSGERSPENERLGEFAFLRRASWWPRS